MAAIWEATQLHTNVVYKITTIYGCPLRDNIFAKVEANKMQPVTVALGEATGVQKKWKE